MIEMIKDKQQKQSQQFAFVSPLHADEMATADKLADADSAKVLLWRQAGEQFEQAVENDPESMQARQGLRQVKRLLVRSLSSMLITLMD